MSGDPNHAAQHTSRFPRIRSYHHPHLLSITHLGQDPRFSFKPFDGTEVEPLSTEDLWRSNGLSYAEVSLLLREYREARRLWRAARTRATKGQ